MLLYRNRRSSHITRPIQLWFFCGDLGYSRLSFGTPWDHLGPLGTPQGPHLGVASLFRSTCAPMENCNGSSRVGESAASPFLDELVEREVGRVRRRAEGRRQRRGQRAHQRLHRREKRGEGRRKVTSMASIFTSIKGRGQMIHYFHYSYTLMNLI